MNLTVRAARYDDLAALNAIYNESVLHSTATFDVEPRGEEEARAWFLGHGPAYPLFTAEAEGRILGWSSLSPFAPRPAYRFTVEDSIYVHEDYRGQGVGRSLLTAALAAAQALGYRAVVAKIADHNEASLALHQGLGFMPAGTLTAVGWKFGRWLDVDYLELLLAKEGGRS